MGKQKIKASAGSGEEQPGTMSKEAAQEVIKARETVPSSAEREVMKKSLDRNQARGERVTALVTNIEVEGRSCVWVGEPHNDKRGWLIRIQDAFGTHSDEFAHQQLHYITNMALRASDNGSKVDPQGMNAMLAAADGTRPRDEIEGMLAVQMATTHAFAMDCLMRAQRSTHVPQMEASGNLAVKLLRTYTAQVETLAKLRRGGEQKVEVKHVHVHEGGQAIVGNVSQHAGSMGLPAGINDSPTPSGLDAKALAFAPVTAMWSEEPSREPVPVASDERKDEMPAARRRAG